MKDSVEFIQNRLSLLETALAHKRKKIIGYIFEEKIVTPEQAMDESLDKTEAEASSSRGKNISQIREQAKIFLRSSAGNLILNVAWAIAMDVVLRRSAPDLTKIFSQGAVKAINSGMVEAINKKGMITTLSETFSNFRNSRNGAEDVPSIDAGGLKPRLTPGHEDIKSKLKAEPEMMVERIIKRDKRGVGFSGKKD